MFDLLGGYLQVRGHVLMRLVSVGVQIQSVLITRHSSCYLPIPVQGHLCERQSSNTFRTSNGLTSKTAARASNTIPQLSANLKCLGLFLITSFLTTRPSSLIRMICSIVELLKRRLLLSGPGVVGIRRAC